MQPSSARRLSVTHFKHTSWPCLNQRLRPAVREVKLKVPRCHFTAGQKENGHLQVAYLLLAQT